MASHPVRSTIGEKTETRNFYFHFSFDMRVLRRLNSITPRNGRTFKSFAGKVYLSVQKDFPHLFFQPLEGQKLWW